MSAKVRYSMEIGSAFIASFLNLSLLVRHYDHRFYNNRTSYSLVIGCKRYNRRMLSVLLRIIRLLILIRLLIIVTFMFYLHMSFIRTKEKQQCTKQQKSKNKKQ